jgi:hypothetical protein
MRVSSKRMPRTRPASSSSTSCGAAQVRMRTVGLGDILFVAGRAHRVEAAPVDQRDLFGAEALDLHRHVDRGVAGADHDGARGTGSADRSLAWRSAAM